MNPVRRRHRINALIKRDGRDCWLCGKRFRMDQMHLKPGHDNFITFDHVKPRSAGGTAALANLKLAHRKCNALRGNIRNEKLEAVDR